MMFMYQSYLVMGDETKQLKNQANFPSQLENCQQRCTTLNSNFFVWNLLPLCVKIVVDLPVGDGHHDNEDPKQDDTD